MNKKRLLFLVTSLIFLISLALISTVSAEPPPPPCLTTNLCFEDAIKATNFNGATDLAVGYLNAGTNLDFVTTGWSQDQIRIKTGSGDGTFWGTWTMNMGDGTFEVDAADFNGDGLTDIIATNSENDQVYIRWGHTGWSTASVWNTGNHPHYLATGDLNNDGLDDFATGNTTGSESITVRLRLPGGGFAAASTYSVHDDFLGDVAFNDCDNDGDLDMLYSAVWTDPYDQEAHVYVRLNTGSGTFSAAQAIDLNSVGYGINIGSIAFGDLDQDGHDDMIVTRNDHKLIRVLGGPNCSFNSPVIAGVDSNPRSIEIADMNGDGLLDAVVSHALNQLITIYLGQGDGNMTGPYEPELTLDWHVRDIGLGDFNDDGRIDIVYAEESGVWLLLARDPNSSPWIFPYLVVNDIAIAPAGTAQVELDNGTLILSNIGASGDDGADMLLDSARLWSSDVEIEGRNGAKLSLEGIANETSAGTLDIISTRPGMEIRPKFRTTNMLVEFYNGPSPYVTDTIPVNSQIPTATVNWDEIWCLMDLPPTVPSEICHLAIEYGLDPEDLYHWQIDFPMPLVMTGPDGNPLTATGIRITEIPDPQNPPENYGFSRMEIRGATVDSLAFENMFMESTESTLFTVFLPGVLRQ